MFLHGSLTIDILERGEEGMNLNIAVPYRRPVIIDTEGLAFLGSGNLSALREGWQDELERLSRTLAEREAVVATLESPEALEKVAITYDNPDFPKIGVPFVGAGMLEPLDWQSKIRESDTTTFNVCGWCHYVEGGCGRCHYHSGGDCGLLPESLREDLGLFAFNTPCYLRTHPTIIPDCREKQEAELLRIKERKEKTENTIRLLDEAIATAEWRPMLPDYRPFDWVSSGDEIVFLDDDKLMSGEVTKYEFEHIVFKDGLGQFRNCMLYTPLLVRKDEWEFLKRNSEFLDFWIRNPRLGKSTAQRMKGAIVSS